MQIAVRSTEEVHGLLKVPKLVIDLGLSKVIQSMRSLLLRHFLELSQRLFVQVLSMHNVSCLNHAVLTCELVAIQEVHGLVELSLLDQAD